MKRRRGSMGFGLGLSRPRAGHLTYPSSPSMTNLKLWLKADAGTFQTSGGSAAVADNDPVGEWQDQSGTGNHVAQATAGKRPLLKTAVLNSKAGILFDGTDDYLNKTLGATLSQPNTVYFVCKRDAAIGGYTLLDGPGATRHLVSYKSPSDLLEIYAGTLITSGVNTLGAAATIITVQFNGASTIARRGGIQILTGNPGAQGCGGFIVGINNSLTTVMFKGHIHEILFYNMAHSGAEISDTELYLTGRWLP